MGYFRTLLDARITEIRVPQITTPHRVRIQADVSESPRAEVSGDEAEMRRTPPAEISRGGHRASLSSAGEWPPAEAELLSAGESAGERRGERGCTLSLASLARVPTSAYVSGILAKSSIIYRSV